MSQTPHDSTDTSETTAPEMTRASALIVSRVIPLGLIIAATVFAGVWRLPEVRLWVVETLGPYQIIDLESALADPSEHIATRACTQILASDRPWANSVPYAALYQRPSVALACLEEVTEEPSGKPAPDTGDSTERVELSTVSHNQLIASRLGRRWLAELDQGTSSSCVHAASARRALELAGSDAVYPMLYCAVGADSAKARACCVEELGGTSGFTELLDDPKAVSLVRLRRDYTDLVETSFALGKPPANAEDTEAEQQGDEPEQPEEPEEPQHADVHAKKQDWVVSLGCQLHFEDPARRQVVRAFQSLIESPECAPDDVPWQGYYMPQSWSMLCDGMYQARRNDAKMSPPEAICDSLKYASIADAIGATQLGVEAAVSRAVQESETFEDTQTFVGAYYSRSPIAAYETGRARRRTNASPRARSASHQILGSMSNILFQ